MGINVSRTLMTDYQYNNEEVCLQDIEKLSLQYCKHSDAVKMQSDLQ